MTFELSQDALPQIIKETCQYPPESVERQAGLTRLICLLIQSGKLWRENTPYYEDALQQTWLYVCRNLCEANTGKAYDPNLSNVTTWVNSYLKRRLQDYRQERQQRNYLYQTLNEQGLDQIETPPPVPSLLETVRDWANTDADGSLRGHHLRGHPTVTCQVLILRRLPPRSTWEELSQEFNVPPTTLSSFYRRHCFPKLRQFGKFQGYL